MSSTSLRPATLMAAATSFIVAATACNHADPIEQGESTTVDAAVPEPAAPGTSLAADAAPQAYEGCGPTNPFDPGKFEFIPLDLIEDLFIHRLAQPTELGEDLAIHVRLPQSSFAAGDPDPQPSLVAVLGAQEAPVFAFSSDALLELGLIEKSPGKGFFTVFAKSDEEGLAARASLEKVILESQELSDLTVVFEGRHAAAVTSAQPFSFEAFQAGELVGLGRARITPASVEQNWKESVFITDPAVVQDPDRTVDTCTGEGNGCGPWTFCHLMTEMANEPRTGISPEELTQKWLGQWLDDYTVNGDTVDARSEMMGKVISPWLEASGGEQLDLSKSPFRLLAIVNRLDLRSTELGGGGYGSTKTSQPADAGELRFVFGAMAPSADGSACEPLPFTVIFEYGVPVSGCNDVRGWARKWTELDLMGGFGGTYRERLQELTDAVVTRDVAPLRGNGSAINQIRTNEIALSDVWEMREFALADQSFTCDSSSDAETDGFLRPHTVALTPDDEVHAPTPNGTIDAFVNGEVVPNTAASPCASNFDVPPSYDCTSADPEPLLGANALVELNPGGAPPGAWHANPSAAATTQFVCGRHQFSLNTCSGCHACDTATTFTHVDPMSGIPAALSGFLLGTVVEDTQFPGTNWKFADLDRRYQDLYDVAGAACVPTLPAPAHIFDELGFDPFDPVIKLDHLKAIFDARLQFTQPGLEILPIGDDLARLPFRSH